jgi:hypothetical protein
MPRGGTYNCVTATLGATKITLADETCDKKLPFICEVCRSTQKDMCELSFAQFCKGAEHKADETWKSRHGGMHSAAGTYNKY